MKEWIRIFQQILLCLTKPPSPPLPSPPTFTPPSEKSKKEIFYDLMLRRLDSQAQRIDEVTAHAGNWLSGTGLLIAFPGLLLAAERNDLDTYTFGLIGGAGIVYIIGLFLVFISPLILPWRDGPHWQDLAVAATDDNHNADDLYYSVGYAIAEKTLPWNKRKINIQYILMYLGLFCVLTGVVVLLVTALQNLPAHHTTDIVRVIIVTPTP